MENGVYVSLIDGHFLLVSGSDDFMWTFDESPAPHSFISSGGWSHSSNALRVIIANYEYLGEL